MCEQLVVRHSEQYFPEDTGLTVSRIELTGRLPLASTTVLALTSTENSSGLKFITLESIPDLSGQEPPPHPPTAGQPGHPPIGLLTTDSTGDPPLRGPPLTHIFKASAEKLAIKF